MRLCRSLSPTHPLRLLADGAGAAGRASDGPQRQLRQRLHAAVHGGGKASRGDLAGTAVVAMEPLASFACRLGLLLLSRRFEGEPVLNAVENRLVAQARGFMCTIVSFSLGSTAIWHSG
jgi:hypothetical protein